MEDKRLAANPSGLCMCGCGRKTKIVTKSDRRHGHVMGQPFRFIHGYSRPAAKGPNRLKLRRRTAVILLERRNGTVLECLVSRKDFHRVRRHHWYVNKNGKRRPTRSHGLTVRKFRCTNTSVLIGRRLTTRTATGWIIDARIKSRLIATGISIQHPSHRVQLLSD